MKKIIIGIILFVIIIGGLFFYKKGKQTVKDANEVLDTLTSYTLEANMEMLVNDELKSYKVDCSYLKKDIDYFSVTLYDKVLNQSQTIIAKGNDVQVFTPTLSKVYTFTSNYPYNSEKPYIYQTLLKKLIETKKVEKVKDGYIIEANCDYRHDPSIIKQEIKFDKNFEPIYVTLYDQDEVEKVKLTITSFEMNKAIDENIFELDIDKKTSALFEYDEPLIPVINYGSELEAKEVGNYGATKTHILQYTGDKSFTIVETMLEQDEYEIVNCDDEMIDFIGAIGFISNKHMSYIMPGMMCSIYSDDLNEQEMIQVVSSLQVEVLK